MYPYSAEEKCAFCGTVSEYSNIGGGHSYGTCDLDFRPGRPYGSAVAALLSCCPECGYVAYSISEPIENKELYSAILNSRDYQSCCGHEYRSTGSKKYYRYYLIQKKIGTLEDQIGALLGAIWCADDFCGCKDDARLLRSELLPYLDLATETEKSRGNYEYYMLIKIDVLRRLSEFETVAELCRSESFVTDPIYESARKYQLFLAKKQDDRAYDFGSAIESFPPEDVKIHPENYEDYESLGIHLCSEDQDECQFHSLHELFNHKDDPDFNELFSDYSWHASRTYKTLYEFVDAYTISNDREIYIRASFIAFDLNIMDSDFEMIVEDSKQRIKGCHS